MALRILITQCWRDGDWTGGGKIKPNNIWYMWTRRFTSGDHLCFNLEMAKWCGGGWDILLWGGGITLFPVIQDGLRQGGRSTKLLFFARRPKWMLLYILLHCLLNTFVASTLSKGLVRHPVLSQWESMHSHEYQNNILAEISTLESIISLCPHSIVARLLLYSWVYHIYYRV